MSIQDHDSNQLSLSGFAVRAAVFGGIGYLLGAWKGLIIGAVLLVGLYLVAIVRASSRGES